MEIQKMKVKLTLASFNPSIYKYMKIPLLMYHYDGAKIEAQGAGRSEDTDNRPSQSLDQFLSGHYIIENIDYTYAKGTSGIRQEVTLIRREWPTRIKNLE